MSNKTQSGHLSKIMQGYDCNERARFEAIFLWTGKGSREEGTFSFSGRRPNLNFRVRYTVSVALWRRGTTFPDREDGEAVYLKI